MSENCPHCRTFALENEKLTAELSGMLHTTRQQAATIAALTGQRTKRRNEEDLRPHLLAILRLHHALLGSRLHDKQGRIIEDGKNAEIARDALKKYTAGTLGERRRVCMDAVRGLALRPYAGPKGRSANPGNGARRYAGLHYALGDENRIAEHAGFYRDTLVKPLEWQHRAWMAAIEIEARYRYVYLQALRRAEREQHTAGVEIAGRPQLELVVDNTAREAA